MLDVLVSLKKDDGSPHFSADEITGMFISMMFAGHHTSSGTAAWTLIELLRNPEVMKDVVAELDDLYADGSTVSFQALREIPRLESALKETLRLHPPLVLLLRVVKQEIEIGGHTIPVGAMVGATPAISNRIPEDFPFDRVPGLSREELAELDAFDQFFEPPKVLILRMRLVPVIDASGVHALRALAGRCHRKGIALIISGLQDQPNRVVAKMRLEQAPGELHFASDFSRAVKLAASIVGRHAKPPASGD